MRKKAQRLLRDTGFPQKTVAVRGAGDGGPFGVCRCSRQRAQSWFYRGFSEATLRPAFRFRSGFETGPLKRQKTPLSLGCSPAIAGNRATRECALAYEGEGGVAGHPPKSTLLTRRM